MNKTDIWMPLYIGDYLADTMHLNPAQHGSYLLILMHHWRSGPIADDDAQLAAIARCDLAMWKKLIGPALRPFFDSSEGMLTQKRLMAERERSARLTEVRANVGKEGAQTRWSGRSKSPDKHVGKADGKRIANPSQNDGPSPLPSKKESDASHLPLAGAEGDGAASENIAPSSDKPFDLLVAAPSSTSTPMDTRSSCGPLFPDEPDALPPVMRADISLFTHCAEIVGRLATEAQMQRSEHGVRSFIGKMMKDLADDKDALFAIVRDAEAKRPADPWAWITGAVKVRAAPPRQSVMASRDAAAIANRARLAELESDLTGRPHPQDNFEGVTIDG